MRNERVELKVEVGVEEGRHRRRAWLTEHAGGTEAKRWSEDRAVTGAATRMTRLRGEVFFGEGANGRAGAGETVAAGGAQVFCEVESSEGIEVEGGDISGRGAAVEIAQQGDQTANERAVGFAAEAAATVADFADEMHERDAAADAVRVGAFGLGEGWKFFRAIDDGAEAFLGVVDEGEVVGELSEFFGEGHGPEVSARLAPAQGSGGGEGPMDRSFASVAR